MDADGKKEPMTEARCCALKKFTSKWQNRLLLDKMAAHFPLEADGLLCPFEWEEVFRSEANTNAKKFVELTRILCSKANEVFDRFVTILTENHYEHYAEELKKEYQKQLTANQYEKNKWLNLKNVKVSDQIVSQGTFGEMYRAKWFGSDCIVKTFRDVEESEMKYIEREIHYCALFLKHRNIVQIYGLRESKERKDSSDIVMERLRIRLDVFLKDHKANRDSVPLKVKHSILRDVASGMRYLHDESIFHRNLNAESIMLTSSMVAKICDLGMARESSSGSGQLSELPQMEFSAPEMKTKNYGPPCDYFAFGCLVIHMIIHVAPKRKEGTFDSAYKRRQHHLEGIDLSKYEKLAKLVHDCLEEDPLDRPNFTEVLRRIPEGYSDEDAYAILQSSLGNPTFYSGIPGLMARNLTALQMNKSLLAWVIAAVVAAVAILIMLYYG